MDKITISLFRQFNSINKSALQKNNNSDNISISKSSNISISRLYMDYIGNINKAKHPSLSGKQLYEGQEIAISEKELDQIFEKETLVYDFNPVNSYEKLGEEDKKALKHLVKAAAILNDVFLKQDHPENIKMKKALQEASAQGDAHARKALKLFTIFNGLEGVDSRMKPLKIFKGLNSLETKGFFPADSRPEEIVEYLKANPEQIPAILSNHTVVKRENGKFKAVPYNTEYKQEFADAAKELKLAADEVAKVDDIPHKNFAEYMLLEAEALTCDPKEAGEKECAADKIWANIQGCPLEFTIGKESYDDEFTGKILQDTELMQLIEKNNYQVNAKDTIGVRVGIVDLDSTAEMQDYKAHLKELSLLMPLKDTYKQSVDADNNDKDTEIKQGLSDVDLVYMSGDYSACRPSITIAQNLPNDDKLAVKLNLGRKNVFHRQVRQTTDKEKLAKFLDKLIEPFQHKFYDQEADHLFTIGHELSHSLGPVKTANGNDKKATLGDYGDVVEESKADLGSIIGIEYFVKTGKYSQEQANKIYLTWAAKQMPLSNPPLSQPHRVREVMQLNYFIEHGAINFKKDGKLSIITEKIVPVARQMLEEIIKIQLEGNAQKAKSFCDKYRDWNETMQYASDIKHELKPKIFKDLKIPLAEKLINQ